MLQIETFPNGADPLSQSVTSKSDYAELLLQIETNRREHPPLSPSHHKSALCGGFATYIAFAHIKAAKINLSLLAGLLEEIGMDKAELRRAVIARRDALDLDLRAAKSADICARLVELLGRLDAAAPHTVAVYAAMGSEVDSAAFAAAAAKRGWRVAYPCMLSATDAAACGQRMCMRAVAAGDADAAPFIAHPTRAFAATDIDSSRFPIVPAEALDMIVVPLVAFDRTGMRLGYGGGCYDRYLPMLSPVCQIVGIAFDEQRVDHIPTDAHDLPLPNIISA